MNLNEAYKKASDDDILQCMIDKGGQLSGPKSSFKRELIPLEYAISDKWKIIPAEPKVLSAEELVQETIGFNINDDEFLYDECISLAEFADQNGQLREYLRPEQVALRKVLKMLLTDTVLLKNELKYYHITVYTTRLREIIKNLKPPINNEIQRNSV